MKKLMLVCILFSFGLLFNLEILAAEKLGYVNIRKISAEYKKAIDYGKLFEKKQKDLEVDINKRESELRSLQDKFELMNEEQRAKKQPEFQQKARDFLEYRKGKVEDLTKEMNAKNEEISKDIEEAVSEYAEKEGYALVFPRALLLYGAKGYDLTSEIIKIVNKKK
jgi:outer membrane protein